MNNTPETDAKASDIIGFFSCATVPAEFARKLERERDEAKHDFEEQSEVVRNLKVALMEVSKLTRTLKQERDEARKALVRSNHFLQQAEENLDLVYKERDEAREDATNYYARIGELESERDEAIFVMRETRRRLDDAWLEIERLKSK